GGGLRAGGRVDRDRVGRGSAVAAVPGGVDLAGVPEVPAVEVGPEGVQEDELGVGRLPEQEVGEPLLAGGADEQVDVGDVGGVQPGGERVLVHLGRVDPALGDVLGQPGGGVGDLRAAPVVDAELQGERGVVLGHLL